MLVCLYRVFTLRSKIPGGVVGKQWRLLTVLVTLFTVGYFVMPFFTMLPANIINPIVALIFFFGAGPGGCLANQVSSDDRAVGMLSA